MKYITQAHWSDLMRNLETEKNMTTDQAYEWMIERFEVLDEKVQI